MSFVKVRIPSFRIVFPRRIGRLRSVDRSRSDLVLQEAALFLYQQQYDTGMQRAMTMEAFEMAQQLRLQRDEAKRFRLRILENVVD